MVQRPILPIGAGYPVTFNHEGQTDFAADVAREIVGDQAVNTDHVPVMGGEDFSFMLEKRPGAFIFMGNGDTANLHHEEYDFNDEAIPVGCSYWGEAGGKGDARGVKPKNCYLITPIRFKAVSNMILFKSTPLIPSGSTATSGFEMPIADCSVFVTVIAQYRN